MTHSVGGQASLFADLDVAAMCAEQVNGHLPLFVGGGLVLVTHGGVFLVCHVGVDVGGILGAVLGQRHALDGVSDSCLTVVAIVGVVAGSGRHHVPAPPDFGDDQRVARCCPTLLGEANGVR